MKVVVTAQEADLQAKTSPIFGRAPAFVFVDSDTMDYEGVPNPAAAAGGGAGIQAAQLVVERGVQAVLSQNVGPNAFAVLQQAGVEVYRIGDGTVRQAVLAFTAGDLPLVPGANVGAHNGMRRT